MTVDEFVDHLVEAKRGREFILSAHKVLVRSKPSLLIELIIDFIHLYFTIGYESNTFHIEKLFLHSQPALVASKIAVAFYCSMTWNHNRKWIGC